MRHQEARPLPNRPGPQLRLRPPPRPLPPATSHGCSTRLPVARRYPPRPLPLPPLLRRPATSPACSIRLPAARPHQVFQHRAYPAAGIRASLPGCLIPAARRPLLRHPARRPPRFRSRRSRHCRRSPSARPANSHRCSALPAGIPPGPRRRSLAEAAPRRLLHPLAHRPRPARHRFSACLHGVMPARLAARLRRAPVSIRACSWRLAPAAALPAVEMPPRAAVAVEEA